MVGLSPASLIHIGLKNLVFVTNYAWNIIKYSVNGSYYYFIQKVLKIPFLTSILNKYYWYNINLNSVKVF